MISLLIEVAENELPKRYQQWLYIKTNDLPNDLYFIPYRGEGASTVLKFVIIPVFTLLSLLTAIPMFYGWFRMLAGMEYDGASVILLPALAIPFGIIAFRYYRKFRRLEGERMMTESGEYHDGVFYNSDALLIINEDIHTLLPRHTIRGISEKFTENYDRQVIINGKYPEGDTYKIRLPLTHRKEMMSLLQKWIETQDIEDRF